MSKNVLKRGKAGLLTVSIILMVLAVAMCVVGIILAVNGFSMIGTEDANITIMILEIVFGLLICALGVVAFVVAFIMLWTGSAMKTNLGNTKDQTIPQGTINMKKCFNCGFEVKPTDKTCGNCGHSLEQTKTCKSCGTKNDASRKFCDECGKEL